MARQGKPHAWLERKGVKEALATGASCHEVATLAGVSHQAISLYRRSHVRPGMQLAIKAREFDRLAAMNGISTGEVANAATVAALAANGSEWLSRSNELWDIALDGVRKTHKDKDFSTLAPLLNQAHRNLELFGRHTGALNDGAGTGNQLNIALILPSTRTEGPETQGETLEAVVEDTNV